MAAVARDAAARVGEGSHARGGIGGIKGGGPMFLFFAEEKKMGSRIEPSPPEGRATRVRVRVQVWEDG